MGGTSRREEVAMVWMLLFCGILVVYLHFGGTVCVFCLFVCLFVCFSSH